MENKEYKYKFSVIIPIYNVEEYLEETILSVVNQTIGFKENIQLILINDGSTDKSYIICEKYHKMYPNNIIYIKQENQGVSSARNNGMKYIEGKYVNFLDSDDIWENDAFGKIYEFFSKNENEIDLVACRMKFFDAREDYHKLDYKFEETKIVDIRKDYQYIQLSASSTFIKCKELKKYKFDTRLKYFEDAVLINQLIMNKSKYGILSNVLYSYRKRNKKTSAIQNREGKTTWYFDTIDYGYNILIQKSKERYGSLLPYFQYLIMYEIGWRINVDISRYIKKREKKKYINYIIKLLQEIEDYIIMEQKYIKKEYKVLALCLKYKRDIREEFRYNDPTICFKELNIFNINNKALFRINDIKISRGKVLTLYGIVNCFLKEEDYNIWCEDSNKNKFYVTRHKIIKNRPSIIGNLNNYRNVKIKIPINKNNQKEEFKIFIDYKSNVKNLNINFTNDCEFSEKSQINFLNKKYKVIFNNKKITVKNAIKINK